MHTASVVNRGRKDEGLNAHRSWRGKEFTKPAAEFGDCALCARAMSAGNGKFDARWKEGAWVEVRLESGDSSTATSEGVVKARDSRRKAENGGRWSAPDFGEFVGVPWARVQEQKEDLS